MNLWSLIPLLSGIAYISLLVQLVSQLKSKVNRVFFVFLCVSFIWTFSAFMLTSNPNATREQYIFWNSMVLVGVVWSVIANFHFVLVYTGARYRVVLFLGYSIVGVMFILSFLGYVVRDAYMVNGYIYHDLGIWMQVLMGVAIPVIIITIYLLATRYAASKDPMERNRLAYLLAGMSIVAVYGPVSANIPALAGLPTDHLGTLANAVIITITIQKYKLLDFGLLARRTLAYAILSVGILGSYIGIMVIIHNLFTEAFFTILLFSSIALTIVMAMVIRPLRFLAQDWVDRMFKHQSYTYRQVLLDFNNKIYQNLKLDEISGDMLSTIGKTLHLTYADLLLVDHKSEDFVTRFTYPQMKTETEDKLKISHNSGVVNWLAKEDKPIYLGNLDNTSGLSLISREEKAEISDSRLALLLPIINREKMIGILALGGKRGGDRFRAEDIDLVEALGKQASLVIENAQLYAQAEERANIDELTGLFNHRYLHQRINEEIARASRFGEVFCLLALDLDFFKTYNDTYGHLYGDMVLQKVGKHIQEGIRTIDIAFRYGGDEFAVLLPQTSVDGALRAAERIRKLLEGENDTNGMEITCSIGVASWPADGVMREELIQAADSTLYYAKQNGKNRVCLASKLAPSELAKKHAGTDNNMMVLNTIYALAATVDAKDHYTFGHSKKVSKYAADIAREMGFSEEKVIAIRTAGLLHDIGKIGVSDQILGKPGELSDEEWEPIRAHPTMGVSIIRHIESLKDCLAAVQYHHEKWDGSGYPTGLKGENIPLDARILSVADSYDAMTSSRPYRNARKTNEEALEELIRCAGTQFDPDIVKVFARVMNKPNIQETAAI